MIFTKARLGSLPPMNQRERTMARAFLGATQAVQRATHAQTLESVLAAGNVEGAVDTVAWTAGEDVLRASLPKQYRITLDLFQERGRKEIPKAKKASVAYSFGGVDQDAVSYASERAGVLIREWGATNRLAVRAMVLQALQDGIQLRDLARLIVQSGIGLTTIQAGAVERMRDQMVKSGVKAGLIESRIARYAAKLLKQRAEMISRTEIVTAENRGRLNAWRSAGREGLIDPAKAKQRWMTVPDERLCDICGALDGVEVPLGETFPGGYAGPAAHPRCRCRVVLVV